MPNRCADFMALLPEYIDDELALSDRIRLEEHLAQCPSCRRELELQQAWLPHRHALTEAFEKRVVPAGLNDRIMSAVRAEHATPHYMRWLTVSWRRSAYRLAGAAAMVVLLLVALRLYQGIGMASATTTAARYSLTKAGNNLSDQAIAPVSGSQELNAGTGSNGKSAGTAAGWLVYNGSLANLDDDCVTVESAAAQATAKRDLLPAIQTAISQARILRILTKAGPPSQTLILTAWPSAEAESQLAALKNAFATCENTPRIEIIKAGDLPAKLNSLETNLYARIFEQPPAEYVWILILMGE